MTDTNAMREKLISTLKAAGGIHNPDVNAPHIADAILPLFTPAVCEAEQAIKDALMDSQYLAGVTAGWNAAQSDDPEAVLAGLLKSREGHLKGYKEAKGVLALLATDRAAGVGEPIGWQYALDPCPVTKRTRWIRTLYADEAEAQRVAADFMGEGKYLVRPVYAASPPAPADASGEVEWKALTWIDVLREWFGGERYARDYEYLDANYRKQAERVANYRTALNPTAGAK